MIRVTDMTLVCLEKYSASPSQLKKVLDLLVDIEVDYIEITPSIYKAIGKLNEQGKYIMRIQKPEEADKYPEFNCFVCKKTIANKNIMSNPKYILEIQINDIREVNLLSQYSDVKNIRLTGLDDILNHNYKSMFKIISRTIKGQIEICPENEYNFATAIAVEWILNGETEIVTTFGGIDNKASLEEVMMALKLSVRYKPNLFFGGFPELAELMEKITKENFSNTKAVIGKNIFNVESGIHVDGIIKSSKMYEPFLPEMVGNSRTFVVGKHSGSHSIIVKLKELGLINYNYDILNLLKAVKLASIQKNSSLTDEEFLNLANNYKVDDVK